MAQQRWKATALVATTIAVMACGGGAERVDTSSVTTSAGGDVANANVNTPAMTMSFLHTVDMGEIEAGKLAQTKATNAQVKEYARMMVTDHCKSMKMADSMALAGGSAPASGGATSPDCPAPGATTASARAAGDTGAQAHASAAHSAPAGSPAAEAAQMNQQVAQTLQSTPKGAAFDSVYMAAMVNGHQTVLSRLESMKSGTASGTGSAPAGGTTGTTQSPGTADSSDKSQAHLNSAIEMVRTHLQRAQTIQTALRGK